MSFFGAGALTSAVGHKIEQATDGGLPSENWALNMEICDYINESVDGPKDAIKAIKKRLAQGAGKNYTIVMYTLTVLETCVKNCGRPFHLLVCNKEFIQELVKLIGPKNDPPTVVQEKVLSLIQCWADAFQNQPELSGVVTIYQDLRSKGIEFPMTDLDTMAPIYTPQRSVPEDSTDGLLPAVSIVNPNVGFIGAETMSSSPQRVSVSPQPPPTAQTPPNAAVTLTPNQISKLQGDLNIVQGNMTVMSEMLNEMTSVQHQQHHTNDLDLLHELHSTLQAMQSRLVDLIGKISDDTLTGELLRVNDELNGLMLRHQRFTKNRGAATSTPAPSAVLAAAIGAPPTEPNTSDDSLIDLSEPPSLATLNIADPKPPTRVGLDKDEFDMFAQSRNLTYENTKNGTSSYADNINPEHTSVGLAALSQSRPTTGIPQPVDDNERDFDEIAAWLKADETAEAHSTEESVTSSDFDKFLAERAAAAEAAPLAQGPRARNVNKKKDEDTMFAL